MTNRHWIRITPDITTLLDNLPGGERAKLGLSDLEQGTRSIEAMWLLMACTRFRENGIVLPDANPDPEVHLRLHAACVARDPTSGHATYRALNDELSSLLDALEARIRRARSTP